MSAGEHSPQVVCTYSVVNTVEPLEKSNHVETIDPTPTDMMMIDCFVPVFFAYRLADNADKVYEQLVNRIKGGLQKVLVPFFPWAGRWIEVPSDRRRQLQCNDKGVPFIEAYVDQNLDSVVRFSADFQPVLELQGYSVLGMNATKLSQEMLQDGLPCAFVQVTRFKCGGLVVAVTFNHMLSDGKSFFDFMTAWSEFSRTNKTNIICDHNRAALTLLPEPSLDVSTTLAYVPPPNWDVKGYEVSASFITSLKSEVKRSGEGAYVSTMDCIIAHMWKTLSSLSSLVIGRKEIGMVNAVEGRTRFSDPPLPNVLGNFVVNMMAPSISTAEILKMPTSVIASKIREKMITTDKEMWVSYERAMEAFNAHTTDKVLPWGQTCWSAFPLYKIDFGFGNPFFSPGLNSNFSWGTLGMTYVGPPTPGVSSSAAFMVIQSTPQLLEALEQHPEFRLFFLPESKFSEEKGGCSF